MILSAKSGSSQSQPIVSADAQLAPYAAAMIARAGSSIVGTTCMQERHASLLFLRVGERVPADKIRNLPTRVPSCGSNYLQFRRLDPLIKGSKPLNCR